MAQDDEKSAWNGWPEPEAAYGHCQSASSLSTKLDAVMEVGDSVEGILAIKVLWCHSFSSPPGYRKYPCPEDSVFDSCIRAGNDGRGNNVGLGVLRASARTDASGSYEGCPDGATLQSKLNVLRSAQKDPRTIDAIMTLSCSAATAKDATPATKVDCPVKGGFGYCIGTPNDGLGNAVTLGVVRTYAWGDPRGLYGECDQQILPGFSSKLSVLPLVGKSTDNVRLIDLLGCAVPWGIGGGFPSGLHVGACVGNPWVPQALARRYDYCIWGTDARNAGIIMGVSGGN